MSQNNDIIKKDIENLSEKENINALSNSNLFDNNDNMINLSIKEKEENNQNENASFNQTINNKEFNNKNKNEERNNSILSNNKDMVHSQSSSIIKEGEKNSNNKHNTNKNLNNLELNYFEMSKQLEELRNESSFLKNKLNEISQNQNNLNKNNKNIGNTISFNKATFINIKKLKNIRYDDPGKKQEKINNNKKTYNSRNIQKVKSSSKIKMPLFKSFFENSFSKKKHYNNSNKTFINDINKKIINTESNIVHENYNNKLANLNNNLLLNNNQPTKLFPLNNLLFTKFEPKELSGKSKLMKKLNNNLIEQNKLAEEKISILLKNKNKINERLNIIQKEKDEYKTKKESEIKKYMQNLKNDTKIIKELYNEKHKLMKSKRESELLNQKLKNIILEKRKELNNLYNSKRVRLDNTMNNQSNNRYIKNIKQKYYDINKENEDIKNKIISLQQKLGVNQQKELNIKKYMHNIYTLSSSKKLNKPSNLKLFLTEKKENLNFDNNNSKYDEINDSIDFENQMNNNEENSNILNRKNKSENTNISNNDTININNEEIKIFNKYINIISENKSNLEKLSELQNELNQKNETIKNLEKQLKEDMVKDTLIENMKKEKNELQKLLAIEKEKTLKLKNLAEEEQKKHIKYKNKLEKYKKKSKTEEKKLEKEENKKPDIDYFIYSNSSVFDENKNVAKLKEDIFKLKQLLDEEKNKNEVLQILSENQKEKHELVKNKYDKTKQLNATLMNKIKEKEFSINKEIKLENEALKKQLVETENKNEELKKTIKKLNEQILTYKNNENKENDENKDTNENIENNLEVNPINNIKGEKNKSEKKNYIGLFPNNIIQNKKDPRYSVQISKLGYSSGLSKKFSEKITIPKSNKDLILPQNDQDKLNLLKEKKSKIFNSLHVRPSKNMNSASKKIPTNKTSNNLPINEFRSIKTDLNLNNSDLNKGDSDQELENKIKIQRRNKRESSEKVLRIVNGNNISSSEFSSEKNFSENNKGTQIGISNVIKENENEDEEEKGNGDLGEIKEKNEDDKKIDKNNSGKD